MEIWEAVKGYKGFYEISNKGKVKRISKNISVHNHHYQKKRFFFGRILKGYIGKRGYSVVVLHKNNIGKMAYIHSLVTQTFLGCRKKGLQVNHKDGIKTNNNISNLEYVTPKINIQHAYNIGIRQPCKGSKHPFAKLDETQIRIIRKEYSKNNINQKELANKYKINAGHMCRILHRKYWKHI